MSQKRVTIVVDRDTDRLEETSGFSSLTSSGSHPQRGSRQRSNDTSHQLTPQERRQYEWYMKKFEKADMTVDPNAERERISMVMTALFPHHSHLPPERHEQKVGKKKGQHETEGTVFTRSLSRSGLEPLPHPIQLLVRSLVLVPPRHLRARRMSNRLKKFQRWIVQ